MSIRRRDFITLLCNATAWPLAARAQQGARMRRIGVLIGGEEGDPVRQLWMTEFRAALQARGWTGGLNIQMDVHWAAADGDRARALAVDLVALKPDVLFADNTFVAEALQRATRSVPIVFARITDPIVSGFVSDLAHPGGNMTGFSNYEPTSLGKSVQFMQDIAPAVTQVGIVVSPRRWEGPAAKRSLAVILEAAAQLHLKAPPITGDSARAFEDGIVAFAREPNGGLIVPGDPTTTAYRKEIIAAANRYKMPVIGTYPFLPSDGAVLSYSAAIREQYEGAAAYVDRILKGEKPNGLPVQQPTKYEMRINLRSAKALGLTVPPSLLAIADEVIE